MNAWTRVLEVPHSRKQNMTFTRPINIVGFRPILSDKRPQKIAHILCDTENVEPTKPAHFATLVSGTPKLLIISGRYGNTEVRASGSANLTMARSIVSTNHKMWAGTWRHGFVLPVEIRCLHECLKIVLITPPLSYTCSRAREGSTKTVLDPYN